MGKQICIQEFAHIYYLVFVMTAMLKKSTWRHNFAGIGHIWTKCDIMMPYPKNSKY